MAISLAKLLVAVTCWFNE